MYSSHKDYASLSWGDYSRPQEKKGKPFQQKGARAQQGQSSPLSGCHGNLLDTRELEWRDAHFSVLLAFFVQLHGIFHICICVHSHITNDLCILMCALQ